MASLFAASGAVLAMLAMLVLRHWLAAGVLAAVALVLYTTFYALIRRADPALLEKRGRESERRLIAGGRLMARAMGGWDLPRRTRRRQR